MTLITWRYDSAARLWVLRAWQPGAETWRAIYSIASNRKPTDRETRRIVKRMTTYYPWLDTDGLERAA